MHFFILFCKQSLDIQRPVNWEEGWAANEGGERERERKKKKKQGKEREVLSQREGRGRRRRREGKGAKDKRQRETEQAGRAKNDSAIIMSPSTQDFLSS